MRKGRYRMGEAGAEWSQPLRYVPRTERRSLSAAELNHSLVAEPGECVCVFLCMRLHSFLG